jgi:hypothetical protein
VHCNNSKDTAGGRGSWSFLQKYVLFQTVFAIFSYTALRCKLLHMLFSSFRMLHFENKECHAERGLNPTHHAEIMLHDLCMAVFNPAVILLHLFVYGE